MGNDQSDSQPKSQELIEENLTFFKKINDDRLGEGKLMQDRNKNFVLIKNKILSTEDACKKYLEDSKIRLEIDMPTIIQLMKVSHSQHNEFCSNFFKVYQAWEYLDFSLEQEILQKQSRNLLYSENELFHMMDCILSGLIYLDSKKIQHGDIRPHNVFMNENIYKINDIQFMEDSFGSGYKVSTIVQGETNYMAPELYELFQKQMSINGLNHQKTEVFSLGLVILEAANLESLGNIYASKDIRKSELIKDEGLKKASTKYSNKLISLLHSMLDLNPQYRLNYEQVLERMPANTSPRNSDIQKVHGLPDIKVSTPSANLNNPIPIMKNEHIVINQQIGNNIRQPLKDSQFYSDSKPKINSSEYTSVLNKANDALKKSEYVSQKYYYNYAPLVKNDLERDEIRVLEEKANFLKRESNISGEEEVLDSSKLYSMYLDEYEKLNKFRRI